MSYYGWKPYVSVAERRRKAEKATAKASKAGTKLSPVEASRGAIAKTFWGKAWCDNLEQYSDFSNRMPRGRTYVRNGSVIDLKITEGKVQAQVMGSSLYKVAVSISAVSGKQWRSISADCAGSIDTLVELLQGKLSKAVMERICKPNIGLFPAPKEIEFSCSCPDWASMCKHVAAVLYGVGARLDQQPELIFGLRRVDAKDLVTQAGGGLSKAKQGPAPGRVLDDALLGDVFGIEMADIALEKKPATPRRKSTGNKVINKTDNKPVAKTPPKAPAARKIVASKKKVSERSPAIVRVSAKLSTTPRTVTKGNTRVANPAVVPKGKTVKTGKGSVQLAKRKSK